VIGEDMNLLSGRETEGFSIPVGRWRDGLCDCFQLGICHPQFWMAWCCFPIALGQVMTRLNLNWLGNSMEEHPSSWPAFKVLLISCIIWLSLDYAFSLFIVVSVPGGSEEYYYYDDQYLSSGVHSSPYSILSAIRQVMAYAYGLFLLILMIRVRSLVRSKYSIPEQTCTGCEDCCCSFWCHCCVVAQMARHVNDYQHNHASCCSDTGLNKSVPHIV
jgi:Cys-rich protein (TIGR01571 family)